MSDNLTQARAELERASLSYYLTASDPASTQADVTRTVDRLEAAGQAMTAAHAAESEPEAGS